MFETRVSILNVLRQLCLTLDCILFRGLSACGAMGNKISAHIEMGNEDVR